MKWLSRPTLICVAALVGLPLPAATKIDLERITPVPSDQPIPTQDFFRPRALAQPSLNRAGTHIAGLIATDQDKHLLMVYDIAAGKGSSLTFPGNRDIYGVRWLGNSRVLFQLMTLKMYSLGIMAADIAKLSSPYPLQQANGSSLVSIPLDNPTQPLVWNRHNFETEHDTGVVALSSHPRNEAINDLTAAMSGMEYAALRQKTRENNQASVVKSYPLAPEAGVTYGYMADKQGELAYAFTSQQGVLSMFRLEEGKWQRCAVDLEEISIVDSANEPGQLLVVGPAKDGKPNPLQLLDARTGELGEIVLQDQYYDFNGWTYNNPSTGDVLGAVFEKGGPRVYWFNEQYQALQKILDGMFPKLVVRIIGSNDTHDIFLVATLSDRQPVSYHWVNLRTRKAGLFKNSAPWIDPSRMQPMQIMQFKTRDGQRLEGYLTLPAGASKASPAPLVVLCHGGPWARDNWGFDGEVQFLAHHGYAVLQPNYRGSTGSVGRFPMADKYDFIKMHHDVTDAVKTVLGTGLIDKDRVGIMGASFGGYLSVSGAAHEGDLYRCAVTNAGVFDWALQVQAEKYDQYDLPYYGRMIKTLGDPKKEVEKYDAMSPLRHVAKIHVPVFVAGGKDDQTVELQQSRKLIAELDRHNIPYEKLFIGGEGHGMAQLGHQVELYDRILAFLDKNLKAKQ
ncbi:MAG TPA: alpha/beta fold hydrolase [Lacunisphaera sp.]|nr:alpha/beta fold hydrolase [Lacunisphaera sp.]